MAAIANPWRVFSRVSRAILIVFALALLPLDTRSASAAPDACAAAGTATNAVIRFYIAVDERQFAAAYRCLAATVQSTLPFSDFVHGYAHTLASLLVLADDDVPNGNPVDHVTIELHAVDLIAGKLVASTFDGRWFVSRTNRLTGGYVHLSSRRHMTRIPAIDVPSIFRSRQIAALAHLRADVTGDGQAEDIYITSGTGCASCHAQEIWVYSRGRLIYQQQVDDAKVIAARNHAGFVIQTDTPGTPGLDSCCPTSVTVETWAWTPLGFALRGLRTAKV